MYNTPDSSGDRADHTDFTWEMISASVDERGKGHPASVERDLHEIKNKASVDASSTMDNELGIPQISSVRSQEIDVTVSPQS